MAATSNKGEASVTGGKGEASSSCEDLLHYCVLDGEAYDVRKMAGKHPGGDLALNYAGGRDLSRTWAAMHAFGSPKKLRAYLDLMRVRDDPDLTRRVLRSVKPELFDKGDGALAALDRSEEEEAAWDRGELTVAPSHADFDADLVANVRFYFRGQAKRQRTASLSAATKATAGRWAAMALVTAGFAWSVYEWTVRRTWLGVLAMPVFGQLVGFLVMHDASHHALSTRRGVNVLGAYWGVAWTSPHEWALQHVVGHHLQPNVVGEDPDVVHIQRYRGAGGESAVRGLLVVIWAIALPMGLTILAPLRLCVRGCYPASSARDPPRPRWRTAVHVLGRAAHLFFFFLWPFCLSAARADMSTGRALVWVSVPQVLGSLIFMAVTQIAHLVETAFDEDDEAFLFEHSDGATATTSTLTTTTTTTTTKKKAGESWHLHQLRTTSNYATQSALHTFFTGGLNHQLEHHLFPTVNHCHLPALAPIVQRVCARHAVPYHTLPSVRAGVEAHLNLLTKVAAATKRQQQQQPEKKQHKSRSPECFRGKVWHRRQAIDGEPPHDLEVPWHTMWLVDLEDEAAIASALGRFPLKFDPRDHLRSLKNEGGGHATATAADLAHKVRRVVRDRCGLDEVADLGGPVRLLTMPRAWGYTFNPISVYYLYAPQETQAATPLTLRAVVFEVTNTPWNDEVLYAHAARPDGLYEDTKAMHVSPFQPMGQTYSWHAPAPKDGTLLLVNRVKRAGRPYFEAGYHATKVPASAARSTRELFVAAPQWTMVGIFLHAAQLLAAGGRFYPHPSGTKTAFSRAVEVLYHSRREVLVLAALRFFYDGFFSPECSVTVNCLAWCAITYKVLKILTAATKTNHHQQQQKLSSSAGGGGGGGGAPYLSKATDEPVAAAAPASSGGKTTTSAPASSNPGGHSSSGASSSPSSTTTATTSSSGSVALSWDSSRALRADGRKKRVAVVGSGIAGNGAALELTRRGFDVQVFEAAKHVGGHARTVDVGSGEAVDVGFQVFNTRNYPRFSALLDDLACPSVESEMSLSVSSARSEWSSAAPLVGAWASVGALVARVRLLVGVLRFERCAARLVASRPAPSSPEATMSIRAFLDARGVSDRVRDKFVAPMVGALWSVNPTEALDTFPMLGVAEFMDNHFMLGRARPKWRTPALRSRDYVNRLVDRVGRDRFHVDSRVSKLVKKKKQTWTVEVVVSSSGGAANNKKNHDDFDAVILACPAEQAVTILQGSSSSSEEEEEDDGFAPARATLELFKTTTSEVVVHRDAAVMPRDRRAWAAWNALEGGTVSYYANVLQPGCCARDTFVTLNPQGPLENVLWREAMSHPLLDAAAAQGRAQVPTIQGAQGAVYFCGAYCGFGFHEDGLKSAYDAVDTLCATPLRRVYSTTKNKAPLATLGVFSRAALNLVAAAVRRVAASQQEASSSSESLSSAAAKDKPRIVFTLPNGEDVVALEGSSSTSKRVAIEVVDGRAPWRLLAEPSMGLAEAYMEGSLELKPSIRAVLSAAIALARKDDSAAASPQQHALGPAALVTLSRCKDSVLHALRANTPLGSRANIAAHYDLSNTFFDLWLDRTMTYSSALFDDDDDGGDADYLAGDESERLATLRDAGDDVLEAAQVRKLDALMDTAGVRDGDRVLEIGCGWGSLALRTAERFPKCEYVAITISEQQLAEARDRVAAAPEAVRARLRIELCDYRDVVATFGQFDRVLSCEMIEAVGHEFLPTYFGAIDAALRGGGAAAVQAITVPDARYASYIRGSDFIRKHVFPGSSLVCLKAMAEACPPMLRLDAAKTASLGLSYARTLAAWRIRFLRKLPEVRALGFDALFIRKWQFYLEYCEAGFATRHIDVVQVRLFKSDETLAGGGAQERGTHGGTAATAKDAVIKLAKRVGTAIFDRGYMPDVVSRYGIRELSAQQLRHCDDSAKAAHPRGEGGVAGAQDALMITLGDLRVAPVAVCTLEANEQHYEVDARFYGYVLGPRRKYSACLYEDSTWTRSARRNAAKRLPAAEDAAFAQVVDRARIDGATRSILDLGCGWGSASLYLAARFPCAKVVGVSNSNSQREYIIGQARERGLENLQIVTLDIALQPLDAALDAVRGLLGDPSACFERALSIEMFEHMKNYNALFTKVAKVLGPQATLFVHIFCHKQFCYHFIVKSDADWMAKYFFAGGTMPSADLFLYFAAQPGAPFAILNHWRNNGNHYALTSEAWLQNMDAHETEVRAVFRDCYPPGETELWWNRWRAFFLACAELFGYADGQEWCIGHYLFEKR